MLCNPALRPIVVLPVNPITGATVASIWLSRLLENSMQTWFPASLYLHTPVFKRKRIRFHEPSLFFSLSRFRFFVLLCYLRRTLIRLVILNRPLFLLRKRQSPLICHSSFSARHFRFKRKRRWQNFDVRKEKHVAGLSWQTRYFIRFNFDRGSGKEIGRFPFPSKF